ncbi:MAG: hypothetical protein GC151_11000 [Betaproteobacteria bacterium]|nr:hypothetical protein [Betaproteobacteria bacterium]
MSAGEKKRKTTGATLRGMRHTPERRSADRGASGYFRADESTAARAEGAPAPGVTPDPETAEDAVVRAVRLGYRIAEEQVNRSRRAAEGMKQASAAVGRGDTGEALSQSVQVARTAGEMLVDVLQSLAENSQVWTQAWTGVAGGGQGTGAGSDGSAGAGADGNDPERVRAFLAEISRQFGMWTGAVTGTVSPAVQPGRVFVAGGRLAAAGALSLWKPSASGELLCDGLIRRDGQDTKVLPAAIGPIRRVEGVWEVGVKVRREATPGTYRGLVLADAQPVGYLEVSLRAAS